MFLRLHTLRIAASLGLGLLPCFGVGVASAQFPGELRGVVVSETTGEGLGAAQVEIPELGRSALSDPAGRFAIRGIEPGRYSMTVRRIGHASWTDQVVVENGRPLQLRIPLSPDPVHLEGIAVRVAGETRGLRIHRSEIERIGAATAGEAIESMPGIVLRRDAVGGTETVSIRGSSPDAVLVLLDGVPLNDPVSGVADLSGVSASIMESVTVLPGAQSARFGPRAEAGVVLIATRSAEQGIEARLAGGSLGEWRLGGEAGVGVGPLDVVVGAQRRAVSGAFSYPRVAGIDDTVLERINADLSEWSAFTSMSYPLGGGEILSRAGLDRIERGLPGKGYAPSTEARQETERVRGMFGWRRNTRRAAISLDLIGASQSNHYLDPAPPFGFPYDDLTRIESIEARGEASAFRSIGPVRTWGGGMEIRRQQVDAGSLADSAPRLRTDGGLFGHAAGGHELGAWDLELGLQGRLDHDELADRWYLNHAVSLDLTRSGLNLHLTNRSGYSPPSLGDQFFREGVAVAPNPDLQAERIPSEWEAGAALQGQVAGMTTAAGGRLYTGDVRGMIVWLPDFRFIWSPRNTDVRRRGGEVWARASGSRLQIDLAYALAAVTYDRDDPSDVVQVAYRPRHTAQVGTTWEGDDWRAGLRAQYTGTRYPAPVALNPLEPFWTVDLNAGMDWRLGRTLLNTAVHVDRIFNEKNTLIFGFPEAGRRIRLEARVRSAADS